MRIAIVQSDIETAIQKHIRSLMAIADDAVISMTFSATRGEDGLTAAVNILAPGQEEHVAAPKKPKAEKAAPAAQKAPEPAPVEKAAETTQAAEPAKEAPVAAAEEAPAQQETTEAAPAAKNSLFSGLAKPSN